MGANNQEIGTQRDGNKWRGRGRGRGRGHGHGRGRGRGHGHGHGRSGFGNKQNWANHNKDGKNDKDQGDSSKEVDSANKSKNDHPFQKRDFSYSQMIPESDLGITEFISKNNKIKGILKERYSDFIVHEIDPDGNIVKLTNLEIPEEDKTTNYLECEKDKIIPEDKWQELINLLEKPNKENPGEVKLDVTDLDKDSRRNTHAAIRKVFGRKLQSNTLDQEERKFIIVKKWTGSDSRDNWTRGKDKEYLHFVVYKQDMDTSETVNQISYRLRFKPSNLNFAGTKDRRACTSQKMSLWHGEPKRFKSLHIRNVWIGNYEFKGQTIKLGQLKGNLFTIALRNISNTDDEVTNNMTSLKENGFINYFGTQRFGTNKDAPTHFVGRALLQADWEKAVNLVLHPRGNKFGIQEAIECWHKEKNAKKALSLVRGSRSSVEASLLRGLAEADKNDYLKALNQLPRNLRLLYLHAYQSFIWNRIVSRRIRQLGLKTLPGDLVLIDDLSAKIPTDVDGMAENEEVFQNESIAAEKKIDAEQSDQGEGAKVRVITAEEAEKIPIDKIVLPTPGFKITLPDNECKEWYAEMLAEDGFTMETLRQKSKEYSVGGSYRNIVAKPSQLDWKILRYKDPKSSLLRTDLEELEGKPEPQDDPDGTFRALVVEIGLDTSTYATIALREVVDYVGALQNKKADEVADTEIDDKNSTNQEIEDKVEMNVDPENTQESSTNVVSTEESVKTEIDNKSTTNQEIKDKVDMHVDPVKPEEPSTNVSTEGTVKTDIYDKNTSNQKIEDEVGMDVDPENPEGSSTNFVSTDETVKSEMAKKEMNGNQAVKREADDVVETPSKKPKI